jgi:hypothetical protein
MNLDEFLALEKGDRVKFVNQKRKDYDRSLPEVGTVIVRKKDDWDDFESLCFTYGDDFHFFYAVDVEKV